LPEAYFHVYFNFSIKALNRNKKIECVKSKRNLHWRYTMKHFCIIVLCILWLSQYGMADDVCRPCPSKYTMEWNGIYLKGFGGFNAAVRPNWNGTKYRTNSGGYVVGGALGTNFSMLNIEGEFSYRNNQINRLRIDALDIDVSGQIEQWCGFGNALVDIPLCNSIKPYVGAGLGYRHLKPGVNFDESSDRSFDHFIETRDQWGVYQVIAGCKILPLRHFNVLAEYRYMNGWSNQRCSNHSACLAASMCF